MIKKTTLLICVALASAMASSSQAACHTYACSHCPEGCSGGHCHNGTGCRFGCHAGACQMPYLGVSQRRAAQYNWHGNFAHSAYGYPVALVVPPTANLQTNWSWGAPSSRISRIDHQFGRDYPGPGAVGGAFRNTPVWPGDTAQFGVYYVRAPWYPIQR